MKTPFSEAEEANFNALSLRKLDFVELDDGWVYAFDMQAIKRDEGMSAANSIRVFKREGVLPESFELLIAAPLLYKTLLACYQMQQQVLNAAEQMQGFLKQRHGVSDVTVDFIVNSITNAQTMIESAVNIPVIGRDAAMKMQQSPLDKNGK